MDKSMGVVLIYFLMQLGIIFFVYPEFIMESTSEAHWLPILFGVIVNLCVMSIYLKGLSYFPNMDIIAIYSSFGKVMAAILLLPIFIYLMLVTVITINEFADIISIVFLTSTPLWSIIGLLLITAAFIGASGIATIFRTAILLAILFLPLMFFIICLSLQNIDLHYFFPLWDSDFSQLNGSALIRSLFPITSTFLIFGFIIPHYPFKMKKVMLSIMAIIPFFFLAVYIPVLTFGHGTVTTLRYPFVMVISSVYVSWLMFDRVTVFLVLSLIAFAILFMAVIIWQMISIVNHFLPKIRKHYIALAFVVIFFSICLQSTSVSTINELFLKNNLLRLYILFFVPLSIYLIGLYFRRRGGYENKAV
ncbi:hypothetical protein EBB07_07875 [Paenibacillaceae bacterium]|nr:hypothetical protein EBB07_07875 [Paenibacillaceae bacterium]